VSGEKKKTQFARKGTKHIQKDWIFSEGLWETRLHMTARSEQ